MKNAQRIYNGSVLVGIACVSVGAGVQFGIGAGLIAGGVLVLGFAVYAVECLMRRGR